MNKLFKITPIVIMTLLLVGCGGYNKLINSGDADLIYSEIQRYFDEGKYNRVQRLIDEMNYVYLGTPREDSMAYYKSTSFYKQGDFLTSGALFDQFRRRYPSSAFIEDVEYMYAKGFYFMSPGPENDQSVTAQAMSAINEYLGRYPNSVKKESLENILVELQNKLYDKSFLDARTYYKIGKYKSAVIALRNALSEYPETIHREDLMYLVTKSSFKLADNSYESLKRDRFLNMMDSYYTFASEFPESKHMKEMNKMLDAAKKYIEKYNIKSGIVETDQPNEASEQKEE